MNNLAITVFRAIFIGIGATLTFDLWGQLLKYAFKISPSNLCLIGRWILYMPEGIFKHSNIAASPQKSGECTVGWVAHYLTGIIFAFIFLALAGKDWLQHPALIPTILFGIATVSAPFFIMQPALGLGIAASKTAKPMQTRLRSLINHIMFGFGIFISGLLLK